VATIIYLARENTDKTEGKGPNITFAAFLKKEDADLAVSGHGVQGIGPGSVSELTVYHSFEEYVANVDERLRRRGLNKLTPDERKALRLPLE